MRPVRIHPPMPRRAGVVYVPLLALTLLIVLGALAIAINRLWVDGAKTEMVTAAEAAALAGAGALVDDDFLRPNSGHDELIERARRDAIDAARGNSVAGRGMILSAGDVTIGKFVKDDAGTPFVQPSTKDANIVEIYASRTKGGSNPVAMFLDELAGTGGADVIVSVRAEVANKIAGLAPSATRPLPLLPLGILSHDLTGTRSDTWQVQIEQRLGSDQYRIDEETGEVVRGSDGLPELVLAAPEVRDTDTPRNTHLLDFASDLRNGTLAEQINGGVTREHLADFDGRLIFRPGHELRVPASTIFTSSTQAELRSIIGEQRLVLLYDTEIDLGGFGSKEVNVSGLVAVRVMDVRSEGPSSCTLVVQPTAMAVRSALLDSDVDLPSDQVPPNRYVHKLQLIR